jgi:hypothetical protein
MCSTGSARVQKKKPDYKTTNSLDWQILAHVMSSPLKEEWRMLETSWWSELNACSKPITSCDDASCLASGRWLPIWLIRDKHRLAGLANSDVSYVIASQGKMADAVGFSVW